MEKTCKDLPEAPRIVSLDPFTLEEVMEDILRSAHILFPFKPTGPILSSLSPKNFLVKRDVATYKVLARTDLLSCT